MMAGSMCDALDVIEQLKDCHEASKLNGHDLQEHIMQITNELSKFHRPLRKFRKEKLRTGKVETIFEDKM